MYTPRWARVDESNEEPKVECKRCNSYVNSYNYRSIEHTDTCTRNQKDLPKWVRFVEASDTEIEGIECKRCGNRTNFERRKVNKISNEWKHVSHEVNCTRNEDESEYDGSLTQPSHCPRCGPIDVELETLSHGSREDTANLEFLWRCPNCTLKFTTISELDSEPKDEHVLQWAYNGDDEIQCVIHLEGNSESAAAQWERAKKNMQFENCYEVSAEPWIIEDLYSLLVNAYDFELEESGVVNLEEEVPGLGED